MKIAAVTDDEKTISQHFGRAGKYMVVEIEDGQIISKEVREKPGHKHHHDHDHEHHHDHGEGGHEDKHHRMAVVIADCEYLLACGMGANAKNHLTKAGVQVLQIDLSEIDEALQVFIDGKIEAHINEQGCGHHH